MRENSNGRSGRAASSPPRGQTDRCERPTCRSVPRPVTKQPRRKTASHFIRATADTHVLKWTLRKPK